MEIVKLLGATKDYIWGGTKLRKYGKKITSDKIAESWEVSFHKDGPSIIDSGINKGKLLSEVVSEDELGNKCNNFEFFPILNKFIDAKDNLSLQVHPSDEYALKNENSFGKTEMWYVIEAENDACLYIGFNRDTTKEEVSEKIKNNTLIEIMNKIPVKKGDCYFIPSGTVHAIGKGCLIYEIQENSNLTYRVYDYGRIGKDGKPRELHVEKALKVLNFNKTIPQNLTGNNLANCKYFVVNKLVNPTSISSPVDSFLVATVIEGNGYINEMNANLGDTFFLPRNVNAKITGNITFITTHE